MSKLGWIIFGAVIVTILGGLVIYSRINNPSANITGVDNNSIVAASDQNGNIADHVFGNATSKVILVEYGDFQCPSCEGAHLPIKTLTQDYKDKIAFVFRNFPITDKHPNAKAAAGAAEAAGLQGKYWEMHNLLYEKQSEWSGLSGSERTDKFAEFAVSLKLDKNKFLADSASKAVSDKINFDRTLGKKAIVDGTPTFYLNGSKVDTKIASQVVQGSSTELKALIDVALE